MFLGIGGDESAQDSEEDDLFVSGKGEDYGGLELSVEVEMKEGCVEKLVSNKDCDKDEGVILVDKEMSFEGRLCMWRESEEMESLKQRD